MSIPDYQTLMLPVLKIAGDGREHRISDFLDQLVGDRELTDLATIPSDDLDALWKLRG